MVTLPDVASTQEKGYAMGMLSGKRALIVGVASKLSIAYGIAQAMHRKVQSLRLPTKMTSLKIAL